MLPLPNVSFKLSIYLFSLSVPGDKVAYKPTTSPVSKDVAVTLVCERSVPEKVIGISSDFSLITLFSPEQDPPQNRQKLMTNTVSIFINCAFIILEYY